MIENPVVADIEGDCILEQVEPISFFVVGKHKFNQNTTNVIITNERFILLIFNKFNKLVVK